MSGEDGRTPHLYSAGLPSMSNEYFSGETCGYPQLDLARDIDPDNQPRESVSIDAGAMEFYRKQHSGTLERNSRTIMYEMNEHQSLLLFSLHSPSNDWSREGDDRSIRPCQSPGTCYSAIEWRTCGFRYLPDARESWIDDDERSRSPSWSDSTRFCRR